MAKTQSSTKTASNGRQLTAGRPSKKNSKKKSSWREGLFQNTGETVRFIFSMLTLVTAIFLLLSFFSFLFTGAQDQTTVVDGIDREVHNWCGNFGANVSEYFINDCFGFMAFLVPVFLILVSMKLLGSYKVRLWKWFLNFSLITAWGSVALSFLQKHLSESWLSSLAFEHIGGGSGDYVRDIMEKSVGEVLSIIVLAILLIFYFVYLSSQTIDLVRRAFRPQDYLPRLPKRNRGNDEEEERVPQPEDGVPFNVIDLNDEEEEDEVVERQDEPAFEISTGDDDNSKRSQDEIDELKGLNDETFEIDVAENTEAADGDDINNVADLEPYDPRKDLEYYKFPDLSLLDRHGSSNFDIDMAEQKENKDRIITILRNFGVEITSIKATVGPTITLYEITPAPGVKISKIRNLEDDIALSLAALGIRIIAPIPGKGTVGIEVPNKNAQIVSMESILNSKKFQETTYELPIALGKTITNEVFMVDLAKLPHLLVAGATGQGKSVGLNAIIGSLLYKKHPAELKFVMVDPKKVEFSIYGPLEKHFLAAIPGQDEPIITDVHKVVQTLKSLCLEMDTRYDLLKMAKCKNIKEYNAKYKTRHLHPKNGHRFLPYIVVIIDEFGDLIMTAGKEIELPIARIAQLARAVGIHMVIATQRPTTSIITGNIKANFPGRMAFRVSSMIDSRTILDRPGANNLVGKGDMLFLSGSDPVRVQCAFLDTPEVERISDFIGNQMGYLEPYQLPEPPHDDNGGDDEDIIDGRLDDMFIEVAQWVVASQQGSTSSIQRKFAIGYNRAGRLMDQLERMGVVSAAKGSKPRDVLIQDDQSLQSIIERILNR